MTRVWIIERHNTKTNRWRLSSGCLWYSNRREAEQVVDAMGGVTKARIAEYVRKPKEGK